MSKKAVLAFSGGLDTSFCVLWLKDKGYEVITVCVDTGGVDKDKVKAISKKALQLGAKKHYTVSAEKDIFENIVAYLVKSGGLYQDIYPQLCADRYVIVEKCVEIALREKTNIIAHGCTAMGNDQVRFDVSIKALGNYEIVAPIREIQNTVKGNIREYEIKYLKTRGFETQQLHRKYSVNQNVLGVTISGSEIDSNNEPAEDVFVLTKSKSSGTKYIRMGFKGGLPVSLNDKKMSGIDILKMLNKIVGAYGIGRFIYTGDCIIGIKGRIAFECPGLYALAVAHKALEDATLSKEQNQFKRIIGQKWAHLVYSGLYYEPLRKDLEKFIESNQKFVSGSVTLKLRPNSLLPVKYSSHYLIKEKGTVYAQTSTWKPQEAEGFIKLFGLSTILSAKR
ncbi:argininosuccinate synthase [Candidatus Peregrinibacteria bacterium]|nr:argininosuccinate synthase [Candidatus Peregrinibacteria bacterium]